MDFHAKHSLFKATGWVATVYFASLSGCLNPAFVTGLTGSTPVPTAPGDTPYVHVLLINATTSKTIDVQFGWTPEYQTSQGFYLYGIAPQQQSGVILGCPINQIGLGSPSDLTLPALKLTDANGTIDVPPSAFPLTLQNGPDYSCGDTVVFTVADDRNSGYGISVSTGRVEGSTQGGPFTGPDTYAILQLLQYSDTLPIPVP